MSPFSKQKSEASDGLGLSKQYSTCLYLLLEKSWFAHDSAHSTRVAGPDDMLT
jgi:hypothetical protein